jgi:hypothetical protein
MLQFVEKYVHSRIVGWVLFLGFLFISGCEKQSLYTGMDGFLKGKISIGPICPVETNPPDPGCLPTAETYKAYPVNICTPDGRIKIAQILPELNGSFITELPAGEYSIRLQNSQNRIGRSNLPVLVSIVSNDSTTLNINIDTGIR